MRQLLARPPPRGRAPWDRWDALAAGFALLVSAWLVAFKLRAYYGLGVTQDLFIVYQDATSWLSGHVLQDHCYGSQLPFHSFLILLPLGLVMKPFGPPGLLFVLALAAGSVAFLAARSLRALGVGGAAAALAGLVLATTPFALLQAYDPLHGFHPEQLAAPLALLLQRALLERRTKTALLWAALMVSIKEEIPLLVGVIALAAWLEEIVRGERKRHGAALAVMALAAVSLPLLMALIKAQPHTVYSAGSFSRLEETKADDMSHLLAFVATHPHRWLGSALFGRWLLCALLGSLGLFALRPHLLVLALPLSLVTWLMHTNPLWPARFAPAHAYCLTVAVVAIASLNAALSSRGSRVSGYAGVGVMALAWLCQLHFAPEAGEVYALSPATHYPPALRAEADGVFARYEQEAKPGEPAIACWYLFRYVRCEDLWWFNRSRERPPLEWILWDESYQDPLPHAASVSLGDFAPVASSGRFTLYRRRSG